MTKLGMGFGAKPVRLLPGVLWRVLPLSVIVLLGIWLLASTEATRTLSHQLEKALETEASETANVTSGKITGVLDAMTSLAGNDFIINGLVDFEDRHNYLPLFFKSLRLPGTLDARVTLTDYRGRRIESNAPGREYAGEPWIDKVMAGENVVELSRDILLIAVPVWQFQRPDGMLVMEVFSDSFWSFLELSSASRVVEIWDRNGNRLHISFDRSGNVERFSGDRDPDNWVTAEAGIPNFPGLHLTVRQHSEIAYGPARGLHRFMLVAVILSVLTIVAGIAATAFFATKPLDRFVSEIDKVGEPGGLGHRIVPFGSTEFQGLSRSLNNMLENLESTTTSRDFFNGVLNSISEILIVTDSDGCIQLANWAATDTTKWSLGELKQKTVFSIVQGLAERTEQAVTEEEWVMEAELATSAGKNIPVQVSVSRLPSDPISHVYVLSDITERKRAEQELAALAQHDILTGLANRSLFQARLREALAQARRSGSTVALMLLDLNKFKDVNDRLGHPKGDALLVQVAERLTNETRETDTVARLGGDEFAVILTNLKAIGDAESVAVKLIEAIGSPMMLGEHEVETGVSIGISICPPEEPDGATMISHADFALYRAKQRGKSAFEYFDEDMNGERLARKALEEDLKQALNRDQFELHFQPKLTAVSGEVTGVEALIRWTHPERGRVPPDKFIPIAESLGMINELSAWVMRQACAQYIAWQESGLPAIPVSVNLSAVQFRDGTLVPTIRSITAEYGVAPQSIELEITESAIIERIDDVRRQLNQLHNLGFKLCIDDFGTGYSSLAYLSRFPIDVLKIDRVFIADVAEKPEAATITMAIIALAESLNVGVIAEGVETREQLDFLRQHGCPEVQGFYFSRPLPADEFSEWFRARQTPAVRRLGA